MEGMTDFNKVMLVGRLTHSPELSYTAKGTPVTRFNLAVNTKTKKQNKTLFIDVVVWGKTAEFCAQYFKKGKGVFVEGYLNMNKWKSSDGTTKTKIEVVGEKLDFLNILKKSESLGDEKDNEKDFSELSENINDDEKNEIPFF